MMQEDDGGVAVNPLKGDWTFDTGTGTTEVDDSGNDNTCFLENTDQWFDDPVVGMTAKTVPSSRKIYIKSDNSFDVAGPITIFIHVYIVSAVAFAGLVTKCLTSNGGYFRYFLDTGSNGQSFRFGYVNTPGGSFELVLSQAVPIGSWFKYACTWTPGAGIGSARSSMNGATSTAVLGIGNLLGDQTPIALARAVIGGYQDNPSLNVNAKWKKVKIINASYTQDELNALTA